MGFFIVTWQDPKQRLLFKQRKKKKKKTTKKKQTKKNKNKPQTNKKNKNGFLESHMTLNVVLKIYINSQKKISIYHFFYIDMFKDTNQFYILSSSGYFLPSTFVLIIVYNHVILSWIMKQIWYFGGFQKCMLRVNFFGKRYCSKKGSWMSWVKCRIK